MAKKRTTTEAALPRQITFAEETIGELRKRMKGLVPRDEVEGQETLPGMPDPGDRLPHYLVTLTAKAERLGVGPPTLPHDSDSDQGEIGALYREKVSRTVEVMVRASSYDDALDRAQVKIDAQVGGLHQLFADYPGEPSSPSWKVRRL